MESLPLFSANRTHDTLFCSSSLMFSQLKHFSRMSRLPSLIGSILLVSLVGSAVSLTSGNDTDQIALLDFKSRIRNDPLGVLSSWNDTAHFCDWHGVSCSPRHVRVTAIDLPSSKLGGSISPYIGNLSFLRELRLQGNNFGGEIPTEIGYLPRLEVLRLSNNSLSGPILPGLSNCSDLTVISLGNNQLVGGIPVNFGSLTKLQFLYMYNNYLTGKIPPSIGNLSSLNGLSLRQNVLDGSIPESLSQLKNIKELGVGANNLSGTIPLSIFNLSTLTFLELVYNRLEGTLPPDLFTALPNLQDIGLGYNLISGSIPGSITNASNLERFRAAENQLTGIVPPLGKLHKLQVLFISANKLGTEGADDFNFLVSLANATKLQRLAARYNHFGGELPEIIGNFSTDLSYFTIGGNKVFGTIPSGIQNLVNLDYLDMSNGLLSGSIPSGIGELQKLVSLYLNGNKLTGNIPSSIGNLTRLSDLLLGDNLLQGQIPRSLGMLQALSNLSLSGNNLSGSLPTEIFSLSSLSISLDLSRNSFGGSLPMEIGSLNNLGSFNVSENRLVGDIPVTLGDCIGMEQLSLAGNYLQGEIPTGLSSLKGLQVLDLSRNNLSGEIPGFLEGLQLQILNLSENNFEGEVPVDGVFGNASAVFIGGNRKLCGRSAELNLPKCISGRKNRNLTLKLVIAIVSVLLCVAFLVFFLCLYRFKKKRKDRSSDSSDNLLSPTVSYQSLLKATDGFSGSNLIGVGAFGSVYKGIIHDGEDKVVIAVKVLNLVNRGAASSFLAECEALRNIRHRNLVKIITACSSIDVHGHDFKALVYEYMANGSLDGWLHTAPDEGNEVRESKRTLSLVTRLNVAIDVASVLDYLHHQCETPIVHCDLKPSNILLDEELVAHVSDFGLARFVTGGPAPPSSIAIRGSTGYVPPEYGMGSEVSTLGDVYSYGVFLLELFTGKRPTDEMFNESMNIRGFAEKAMSGQVEEVLDPLLFEEVLSSSDATTTRKARECLVSIFQIGLACSSEVPRGRLNIGLVVTELNSIRNKLLETNR